MHRGFSVALLIVGSVAFTNQASAQQPAPRRPEEPPADAAPPPAQPAPPPARPTPPRARPAPPVELEEDAEPPADVEDEPPEAPAPPPGAPGAEPLPPPMAPPMQREPPTGTAAPTTPGVGLLPRPGSDEKALREQGKRKPTDKLEAAGPREGDLPVFAEDWWTHARPVFEFHGYFRLRAELFHNFGLGRQDVPTAALWPRPADDQYGVPTNDTTYGPRLCTRDENGTGDNDEIAEFGCRNNSQAGANMRFRLEPELHISDNLRILSQVDLLDNLALGSTPSGYAVLPADGGGYGVAPRSGYAPVGVLDDTIVPPGSATNSLEDSIRVKRAWAEFATPVGQLRFGRMPDHFGMGLVHNAGDGYDDDYQSTMDRIQFITGLKPLDLYLAGSWDFPNEGVVSRAIPGGNPPYDIAQIDDVDQWALWLYRVKSPELVKLALSKHQVVLEGGAYVTLRKQLLANDQNPNDPTGGTDDSANTPSANRDALPSGFARRGANIWLPDLWFRLRYRKFRFEAEGAAVLGSIENIATEPETSGERLELRQYGLATQIEQKLVEDRLRLEFGFGWASGDADVFDPNTVGDLVPSPGQIQINDDTDSTFRFHPSYRVDLILHRNILGRVQGTYYFRPSVEYDFMRKPSGQRFGGGAHIVWSRASQFTQTPGHARDLGIELSGKLYFQSKDGALNDDPTQMGGFFSMLQYGVMFPLAGLDYMNNQAGDTSAAQILRLYLGAFF